MLQIQPIQAEAKPICHKGHLLKGRAIPCRQEAQATVNGTPYCGRHTLEKVRYTLREDRKKSGG